MSRLRIQALATERNINLSQLHAAVNTRRINAGAEGVALGTIRRYWHGTKDGSTTGKPIELIDLNIMVTIARVLQVSINELLNEDELGQLKATLYAVMTAAV